MLEIILLTSLIVVGVGLAAKFTLDKMETKAEITWLEFGIASGVMLCIVIPVTAWAGRSLAYQNLVSYNEYWNGYELSADIREITCSRDGPCSHEYDCDPYTVRVPYDCSTGSGKNRVSKTCYRNETRYHSCPYTTHEYTYTVNTTLGQYTIAAHWLPANPESHRWRSYKSVPDSLPSGVPAFWQSARNRLNANKPDPVAARKEYNNLILASQHTILKEYSGEIDQLKQDNLLPVVAKDIHNHYYANRAYFVGVNPPGDWQGAVGLFNGAFGMELQGDLHLVIVDASKVTNPNNYIAALLAYWQSPELGRDALSKNGLVVVIGTLDGKTVEWSRAVTGMPQGNEALLIEIRDKLKGLPLTPESVLGPPRGSVNGGSAIVIHGNGALENLVWGTNKFERVHMKDFGYLSHEIQPTGWQVFWICFVAVVFGLIAWGICIGVGERVKGYHRSR